MDDFLTLLNKWNQEENYQKIIDCLETLSNTQKLDYTLTCQLARAYNNIADLDKEESKSQLERAEALKEMVRQRCRFGEILIVATGGISTVYANDGGIVTAY